MKRILVIENDPDILANVIEMLELAGYRVFGANNGKDGVHLINQERPDLIICDIRMPEMDGYEVLEVIRLRPNFCSIPFVFLSAMSEPTDIKKGLVLGADRYLIKPFDEYDLLHVVKSLILS